MKTLTDYLKEFDELTYKWNMAISPSQSYEDLAKAFLRSMYSEQQEAHQQELAALKREFAEDLATMKKAVDMGITQVSTSEMLRLAIAKYSPQQEEQ